MTIGNDGSQSRWLMACVTAACVLAFGGLVFADAISPPPEDCPNGSEGNTNHCGPHCSASECTDDTDCDDGMACGDLELCINEVQCESNGGPFTDEFVSGVCEDGVCPADAECQTRLVCITESTGSPASWGCECQVVSQKQGWWLSPIGLVVAAGIFLFLRRRPS